MTASANISVDPLMMDLFRGAGKQHQDLESGLSRRTARRRSGLNPHAGGHHKGAARIVGLNSAVTPACKDVLSAAQHGKCR